MPHGRVSATIPAAAAEVFNLVHDYDRRLEWDSLLREAYLIGGGREAGLGVVSVCRGRSFLGCVAMATEYVTFRPAEVAAVKMVNRPPFFETFAASIRHRPLTAHSSVIEYTYTFSARPSWLRFVLHPVMEYLFGRESETRIRSLGRFVSDQGC